MTATGTKLTRDGVLIERPTVDLNVTDIAALAAEGSVTADVVTSGANRIEAVNLKIDRAQTQRNSISLRATTRPR